MEQPPRNILDDTSENKSEKVSESPSNKTNLWLKRLGIGGFLFFLGKGLLWLFLGKAALDALCN